MSCGVEPVDSMDTVQDCGCCGPFLSVLLDLGIGASHRSIVDCMDLVPFVDPCQGTWAEGCRVAAAEIGRLLFGQRANCHAHWDFFFKGGPNFSGKVCSRGVVVVSLGVVQWSLNWVFPCKLTLEGPHSR